MGKMTRKAVITDRDDLQIRRVVRREMADRGLVGRGDSRGLQASECRPTTDQPAQHAATASARCQVPREVVEVSPIHPTTLHGKYARGYGNRGQESTNIQF